MVCEHLPDQMPSRVIIQSMNYSISGIEERKGNRLGMDASISHDCEKLVTTRLTLRTTGNSLMEFMLRFPQYMHSFLLFVIWELPQTRPCLGEKLCRMRGGIFTFYLYRGRLRLCTVYIVSTTLSSTAQDLTHSSCEREGPVILDKNHLFASNDLYGYSRSDSAARMV